MTAADPIGLRRVETVVLRQPLERPMRASFGLMDARCALLIRVEDAEGAHGWGEVWCNWPTFGAEHRAMTVERTLAPIAFEKPLAPADLFAALTRRTAVLAIQTAEHGPIAQAIGGFDMAVWDCAARRAGLPLAAALGATQSSVKVYASGIDPREMDALIPAARAAGHRRFKLKVGFGRERDLETVRALVGSMGPNERFMLDANQAWAEDDARAMAAALAERADPLWLEEPLRADAPLEAWRAVAARGVRLAGGENLVGRPAFDAAIAGGALGVIQPDAGKWGGITGCLAVARATGAAGRLYCPHHLGGAVGLMAAAHLTAAGGDPASILEMDVNANPLRRDMARTPPVVSGRMVLPEDAGLGIEPDLATLAPLIARRGEARA